MLLNILALVGTVLIVYMSAIFGLHRAAMALVACIIAGAVAFGFFGAAAAVFPSTDPQSVWYYAADALCLFALFAVSFFVLRGMGEVLFKVEPNFPHYVDRIGGILCGAATGYLTVGVCVVLLQMLPMSPAILGSYSPFHYDKQTGAVTPGDRLWLNWDRRTLGFFGYLSENPLGSKEQLLFRRYGDVCPVRRGPSAQANETEQEQPAPAVPQVVPDVDDMLYYHWYRRWQYIKWRTGSSQGPLAGKARKKVSGTFSVAP